MAVNLAFNGNLRFLLPLGVGRHLYIVAELRINTALLFNSHNDHFRDEEQKLLTGSRSGGDTETVFSCDRTYLCWKHALQDAGWGSGIRNGSCRLLENLAPPDAELLSIS